MALDDALIARARVAAATVARADGFAEVGRTVPRSLAAERRT